MTGAPTEVIQSGIPWIGLVPTHWTSMRLRDAVESCVNGIWGDEPRGDDTDTPIIRVADFDRLNRRTHPHQTVRSVSFEQRYSRELQSGDLLIEKSGGGELQPVGMVVQYTGDPGAVCSNFVARMRPRETANDRYLIYLHAHLYERGVTRFSVKQSTGIQNLDSTAYLSERCFLPPVEEQLAIVAYLDVETARIDALVEEKRALMNLVNALEQATAFEFATQGQNPRVEMRESGIEWLPLVPAHWAVKRNMFLFRERNESGFEGLPVLMVSLHTGVSEGEDEDEGSARVRKRMEDKTSYQVARRGDVAYNMMRAWQGAIGAVPVDGLVSPAYVVLEPTDEIDARYFEMLARTSGYVKEFERFSYGIASFRWRLYWEGFKEIRSPIPPIEEQRAIVDAFELRRRDIVALRAHVLREIGLLSELRAATITDAVLGRIDVKNVFETKPAPEVGA